MFAVRGTHMSDATPLLPRVECPCKIMQPLLVPKAEGRTRKK